MNSDKLIEKMAEARTRNNKNWMALLALAFRVAPKEAAKIMRDITETDQKISKIGKRLRRCQ